MLKIFALFLFLFSSLFSMSITYASITIDKPIVQQIQYEEQTQQYNSIYIKYNDKEITIPCVMKKTDTIDKPVLFSEAGSNFIFIAVSRHLGTGLYKTEALIFNADTLQNVPLKKDTDFIRHTFHIRQSFMPQTGKHATSNRRTANKR